MIRQVARVGAEGIVAVVSWVLDVLVQYDWASVSVAS